MRTVKVLQVHNENGLYCVIFILQNYKIQEEMARHLKYKIYIWLQYSKVDTCKSLLCKI